MQTEKRRGIKPRKEEDNDAIRSEEGVRKRKKKRPSSLHQPFSCFVCPVTASSGGKWNYIVCVHCPKVSIYCDIFPLWLHRAD